jgi:hypothetical protein
VEFAAAGDDEAILVTVPPYHVASMGSTLPCLRGIAYGGTRMRFRCSRTPVSRRPRAGHRGGTAGLPGAGGADRGGGGSRQAPPSTHTS